MPELLVFTTRWVLVLGLVTVTVAPATTAPVGSTTVPVISPVGPCAQERAAIKTIVNSKVIERRIPVLLLQEVYTSQPPYGRLFELRDMVSGVRSAWLTVPNRKTMKTAAVGGGRFDSQFF